MTDSLPDPTSLDSVSEGLRARLLVWADGAMQSLPTERTPVAHGKAELLTELRAFLDTLTPVADSTDPVLAGIHLTETERRYLRDVTFGFDYARRLDAVVERILSDRLAEIAANHQLASREVHRLNCELDDARAAITHPAAAEGAPHTWDPETPCRCQQPHTCPATPPSETAQGVDFLGALLADQRQTWDERHPTPGDADGTETTEDPAPEQGVIPTDGLRERVTMSMDLLAEMAAKNADVRFGADTVIERVRADLAATAPDEAQPKIEAEAQSEVQRRSPLSPARKSGHYVADPEGPCWCGDVHYYALLPRPSEPVTDDEESVAVTQPGWSSVAVQHFADPKPTDDTGY